MEIDLKLPSGKDGKLSTGELHHDNDDDDNNDNEGNVADNVIVGGGDGVNVNVFDGNKSGISGYMPQNGMEFETKEDAYSFYREYARSVGFGITIKASRRSKKSGKFIDIKIACSRFGSKRQSSTSISTRSCPKTDCKASMHIKKRPEGKWFIYSFVEEHNHEISPDDFYNAVRGRKNTNPNALCQKKGLQLVLDEKAVQLLLDYFMHMQAEAPGFYYVTDFDKEGCMRNVFWVDLKGRHDYVPFSDVVFFDTHYIRSEYNIPFVPVIGVNHHFQFILLGCAVIGEETQSTLVWLMRSWLRAVGGCSPKVVITDNDKSLTEATLEVFPDASHYFCPWHVFGGVIPNLSHKLSGVEVFLAKLKKCTYRSMTDEEFEKRWQKMVSKFDLGDDKWIQSLYEDRRKWMPTYMRDVFLGGFCTVERSQSVASFFDKYLQKETTVEEFIDQYKLFLHESCEEERKAEIEAQHAQPTLISHSPFEKQMSKLYTYTIYTKFQAEVSGIVACTVGKEGEDERTITFRVDDLEMKQSFTVSWNKGKSDVCCLCHLFEYSGFLCRHALSVLQLLGISTVPSKYILKRWTRKAKIRDTTCLASTNIIFRVQRLNDLCKLAIRLGEEGSLSGEAYQVASHALEEALERCAVMNNSMKCVLETNKTASQVLSNVGQKEDNSIMKALKTKKVPKKRKVQAEAESLSIRIQDSSQDVEQLNQRSLSLHDSFISPQDLQGMELGTRIPVINGYYGVQQGSQALGNLNSISSLQDYYSDQPLMQGVLGNMNAVSARVNHHTTQQNLQGLLQGQFSFRVSPLEGCFQLRDGLRNETSVSTMSKHLRD
ncbi:protein FAR1-RELATED SEQUENCE 2 isoform X2 [Sesamum indicum]|uniref:Protein FAR1-RELATED SEQUENCE n=1 Tax=Sesamum indicum TaxID=4182 RepID=A0A6I9U103_SESIN|nr:protein FAR1-RELATED SEQUENCE 2 isoform X2 [Sesamum indicum]XP_020553553.1 protein FAR1-RELATED SEQUENCE 2 isoform X2 [Sesamum indicum]